MVWQSFVIYISHNAPPKKEIHLILLAVKRNLNTLFLLITLKSININNSKKLLISTVILSIYLI